MRERAMAKAAEIEAYLEGDDDTRGLFVGVGEWGIELMSEQGAVMAKGHGFGWALKRMREGFDVTRPSFGRGVSYFLTTEPTPSKPCGLTLRQGDCTYWRPGMAAADFLASDWLEVCPVATLDLDAIRLRCQYAASMPPLAFTTTADAEGRAPDADGDMITWAVYDTEEDDPAFIDHIPNPEWAEVWASAPTDLPLLLAEVERLQADLERRADKVTADDLAEFFHLTYESLAPSFGYDTREESAVQWRDVPDGNRRLMVATAEQVLGHFFPEHLIPGHEA